MLPFAWVVVILVPGQPEELVVGFVVTLTMRIEAMAAAACAVDRVLIWPGIVFRAVEKSSLDCGGLSNIMKNKTRKNSCRFFL